MLKVPPPIDSEHIPTVTLGAESKHSEATVTHTAAAFNENTEESFIELMSEFDPNFKTNSASSTSSSPSRAQSAQGSIAKSIVLCSGCGEDTKAEEAEYIQCDICERWSHVACIMEQFGLPKSYQKRAWFCAECSPKPLWSETL